MRFYPLHTMIFGCPWIDLETFVLLTENMVAVGDAERGDRESVCVCEQTETKTVRDTGGRGH